MKKIYLTLCTLSLTFAISTNVNAAGSDSTLLDQSYDHNNKHIKRDFNNDFNDPNHVTNDRNNILTDTKNTLKDDYYKTKNNVKNTTNDMLNVNNNGVNNDNNYYRRNVTPTPVTNAVNTNNDDVHMDYGWFGLLGLLGFLGLRKKERVD